jgi:hypothetical protein
MFFNVCVEKVSKEVVLYQANFLKSLDFGYNLIFLQKNEDY